MPKLHRYELGQWVYAKEHFNGKGQIVEINILKALEVDLQRQVTEVLYLVMLDSGRVVELDEEDITGTFSPNATATPTGVTVKITDARATDSVLLGNSADELLDAYNMYTDLFNVFGDAEYAEKLAEVKRLLAKKRTKK